jgi:alkylation response protein AidB-like acyl-CoA dehydrogenase
MNFELTEDQTLLADSVRRCLAEIAPFDARQATVRTAEGWSARVWQHLTDIGVPQALVREADGGLGGAAVELAVIAEIAGAALSVEPISSALIANALLSASPQAAVRSHWFETLLPNGALAVPAFADTSSALRARREGDAVVLDGSLQMIYHAPCASHVIMAVAEPASDIAQSLYLVPASAEGLTIRACTTVDEQRAADLHFESVRVDQTTALVNDDPAAIERAVDLSLLAVTAEGLGSAQRAVSLTIEYLKTRQQFGGPIGRFQALQHRVVGMLSKLEDWRTIGVLGAARFDGASDERRRTLSALKVVASEAAQLISEEAVQLHGGMGMTEDMEISHHFRRLLATRIRYGSRDEHLADYARRAAWA